MRLTEEQKQLRETLKAFFHDKITSAYLKKRNEQKIVSDESLRDEILKLGLFEYFAQKESSLLDLGIIAYESGYAMLPEFLTDLIFAGPYLLNSLNDKEKSRIQDKFGEDFLINVSTGKKLLVFAGFQPPTSAQASSQVKFALNHVPAGSIADCLVFAVGENVSIIELNAGSKTKPESDYLDQTLRFAELEVSEAEPCVLGGVDAKELQSQYFALISSIMAGAASKAFDMTLDYTKTRKQFDTAVSSFQAVQHQLADMHMKVEAMQALSTFACNTAEQSPEQLFLSAQSSIRYAMEAAPQVAEAAIQLHGGIGFTWEYDLHLYLRRIKTYEALCSFLNSDEENTAFIASIA